MKSIAYVRQTPNFDTQQKHIESLKAIECSSVHFEDCDDSDRSVWKEFVNNLEYGDTAVFVSLSNAFNSYRDFALFVKLCDKKKICIRSIEDKIDSSCGSLISAMKVVSTLPIQTNTTDSLESDFKASMEINHGKVKITKRQQMLINMYNAGYKIKIVLEKTGYCKTQLYRILAEYKVPLRFESMSHKKEVEVRT